MSNRTSRVLLAAGVVALVTLGTLLWMQFDSSPHDSRVDASMEHAFSRENIFGEAIVDTAYSVKPGQVYVLNEVVEPNYTKRPVKVESVTLDVVSGANRIKVGGEFTSKGCPDHPADSFPATASAFRLAGVNLVPAKPAWVPPTGHWTPATCAEYPCWFNEITIKKYGDVYIDGVFITYTSGGVTYHDHLDQWGFQFVPTPTPESPRESGTQNPLRGLVHVRNSPILTRAA